MTKIESSIKRFLKIFLMAGGVSAVALFTSFPASLDASGLKKFGVALIIAFLTGGIAAIEKVYNWTPDPAGTQAA